MPSRSNSNGREGERRGGDAPGSRGSASGLPLDDVFAALARRRSRIVLYYLSHREDEAVDRETLCDVVLERDPEASQPERVRISLVHAVVPGLEAAGFVEYDARSGTIRYRGTDSLETVLERARRIEWEAEP